MLDQIQARKWMRALKCVFIWIRSRTEEPLYIEVIRAFRKYLQPGMKWNETGGIVRDLKKLGNFSGKDSILGALRMPELKSCTYPMNRVNQGILVLQDILKQLLLKLENKEYDRARTMASAVHNYPAFLILEYACEPKPFWDDHIGFYTRVSGEDFLKEWEYLFMEQS